MSRLVFIAAYVLVLAASLGLSLVNLRHQRREGGRVPAELEGVIDAAALARIAAYTRERARFGMLQRVVVRVALGGFLFLGPLVAYDRWTQAAGGSFVRSGVLFAVGLALVGALVELPFSLYQTFGLEARHGFNRMPLRLFIADWLKGTVLSVGLLGVTAVLALVLVEVAPHSWWFWVWLALAGLSLLLTFVSPYLIEPLFFKMEPLAHGGIDREVRELAERANVHVGRVLKVDASRRSAHSNAYFTGLGRVKRVVLFDTLLAQMTDTEILAVLAHELGHWKKHHVLTRSLASLAFGLVALYVGFLVVSGPLPAELVGAPALAFPARVVVLGVLASVLGFPLTPVGAAWSRHDEREADRFAVELAHCPGALASALGKLSRENLANLHPHPLFAKFYYSHPPVIERIRTLRSMEPSRATA